MAPIRLARVCGIEKRVAQRLRFDDREGVDAAFEFHDYAARLHPDDDKTLHGCPLELWTTRLSTGRYPSCGAIARQPGKTRPPTIVSRWRNELGR